MNMSEREQLSQFLQQLTQAQAGPKNEEALGMINRAMGQQPDAAYLLVQRALLQDAALKIAQDKIAALQEELNDLKQPARGPGGFLDANTWGRAPAQSSVPASAPAAPMASGYGAPQAAAPVPAAAASGFQVPSFLTSMATTAAGVAAGAFLFQGIGHLFGGHQNNGASAFGLSGPQAFGGTGGAPQTEIINNYFDAPKADSSLGLDATNTTDTTDRFLDASAGSDGFDSAGLDLDTSSDDWA